MLSGTKWADFEKLLTIVKMTLLLFEAGRPVMKSMAMCDHGRDGMGRGLRSPAGREFLDLV